MCWIMLSLLLIMLTNATCVLIAGNAMFLQLSLLQISMLILILLPLQSVLLLPYQSFTVLISEVFEVQALCSLC